jgi:hypothetical protein
MVEGVLWRRDATVTRAHEAAETDTDIINDPRSLRQGMKSFLKFPWQ